MKRIFLARLWVFLIFAVACAGSKAPILKKEFVPDRSIWDSHFKPAPAGVRLNGDEPSLGASDAQTTIVVFSNHQCKRCLKLLPEVRQLVSNSSGKMNLLVKHFPLHKQCNSGLKQSLEPRDCHIAQQLACAHSQGQFWPFLERSMAGKLNTQRKLNAAFRELKMSPSAFFECISDPVQRQQVVDDSRSGQQAGVMTLPAIYVFDNGTQRWWRALKADQSLRLLYQWRDSGMDRFPDY